MAQKKDSDNKPERFSEETRERLVENQRPDRLHKSIGDTEARQRDDQPIPDPPAQPRKPKP